MKKQKALKGLSALLAAAMVLSSAPVPVRASQETGAILAKTGTEAGFEDGRIQTDSSDEHVDEATGYRFEINDQGSATITGYELVGSASDNLGNLNIPGTVTVPGGQTYTVTRIGYQAFKSDSRFTGTLTIPDTVTDILSEAFDGCVNLKGSLIIPDSVVHIEFDAFRECNGMDGELKLGKNLEYIRDNAFYGCSGLKGDITIPASMIDIGKSAFQGCTGFHGHLYFEEGCLQHIYENAFSGLNITGGLEFPGEVWNIYDRAFYECKSLNGPLVFSKGIGYIGDYAFAYCEGLTGNLDLYNDPIGTTVKDNSFKSCKGLGPVLTLDENTSWDNSLGMYSHSFLYCSGFKKVVNKTNSPFDLSALKSDSGSDPSHSWKDESGNTVYEITNGTAYRDDYTPGGDDTKTYSITVKEGASAFYRVGEKDYRKITSAKKGDTVFLVWLYEGDELEFVRWETENKGVVFQDKYSDVTAFTMPGEDVVISYVEKKKGTDPETEADVTVKVGKKKKLKADGKVKYVVCSPEGMVQASKKGKNIIIKGKKTGIVEVKAYDKKYQQVGYWVIEVVPK